MTGNPPTVCIHVLTDLHCLKPALNSSKRLWCYVAKMALLFIVMIQPEILYAQEQTDSTRVPFKFSGTISVTSNGISPIPAFSLEKPAITAFLSLRKKRFSYDQEIAFSSKGIPWFFNNCFRYRLIQQSKFQLRTGLIWGLGYSYPAVIQSGVNRTIAKAERFFWVDLVPRYTISEKVAISSTTYIGYNFEPGSVKRIKFVSLVGNFTKIKLHKELYTNFYPQIFYLSLDEKSDGLFASGILAVGHNKLPVSVSAQVNQTLTTDISPDPGFKWNVSVSYTF